MKPSLDITIIWIICLVSLMIPVSANGAFAARLYFANLTRGTSNAGALYAAVGDSVAIKFDFAATTGQDKWGTLQVLLCDSPVLPHSQQQLWASRWDAATQPASNFTVRLFYGDVDLYDSALNPTDPEAARYVCHGCSSTLSVNGSKPESATWNVMFFSFVVSGQPGDVLDWGLDARKDALGLSTRLVLARGLQVDVTDNHIQVVPEPSAGTLMTGIGAAGFAFLRRRQ